MKKPCFPRRGALACAALSLAFASACVGPATEGDAPEGRADPVISTARLVELRSYWNASLGDNALSSDPNFGGGYAFVRSEGWIFRPDAAQPSGTVGLYTWYSEARGDFFTTSLPYWAATTPGTVRDGYVFKRVEGYVFAQPVAGTAPLQLWWSPSRADNLSTTDPAWGASSPSTRSPDYGFAGTLGHVVTLGPESAVASRDAFHFGTMSPVNAARPLVAMLGSYSDAPMRHSSTAVDGLFFGPASPNLSDDAREMSLGAFRWSRAGVVSFTFPDDPDTHADERMWAASQDVNNPVFAYATLGLPGGQQRFGCVNGGGAGMFVSTGIDAWEILALDDTNGGTMQPGDTVRFKCFNGRFVASDGARLVGTGTSTTAARLVVERVSGTGTITSGTDVRLRIAGGSYVAADLTLTSSASAAAVITLHKSVPDVSRAFRDAVSKTTGFNYATFDTNRDGVVQASELAYTIVVAGPSSPAQVLAATRGVGDTSVPGSTTVLRPGPVVIAGEDASLTTFEHELTHTLGAIDLYGATGLNFGVTLMGATAVPTADDRSTFHLDPWHKLRFGWSSPRIIATTGNGGSARLDAPQLGGASATNEKRPLLVYDPARYDVGSRRGEYFLIELRDGRAGGYDANTTATGVVIWQLSTDNTGTPVIVASLTVPGGLDRACNTFAAPDGARGGTTAWTSAHGLITPRYLDGTSAAFTLRVAPQSSVGSVWVEWSRAGSLTPRLDVAPTLLSRGATIDLGGVFPVSAATRTAALVSASGESFPLSLVSWDGATIRATVPTSTPVGYFALVVTHGGLSSNATAVTLR